MFIFDGTILLQSVVVTAGIVSTLNGLFTKLNVCEITFGFCGKTWVTGSVVMVVARIVSQPVRNRLLVFAKNNLEPAALAMVSPAKRVWFSSEKPTFDPC